MDILVYPILSVTLSICHLYGWGLLIYVVLSWLEHFNVLNRFHPAIYTTHNALFRLYEPVLSRLRGQWGMLGGLDVSPILLWLALMLVEGILSRLLLRFF